MEHSNVLSRQHSRHITPRKRSGLWAANLLASLLVNSPFCIAVCLLEHTAQAIDSNSLTKAASDSFSSCSPSVHASWCQKRASNTNDWRRRSPPAASVIAKIIGNLCLIQSAVLWLISDLSQWANKQTLGQGNIWNEPGEGNRFCSGLCLSVWLLQKNRKCLCSVAAHTVLGKHTRF